MFFSVKKGLQQLLSNSFFLLISLYLQLHKDTNRLADHFSPHVPHPKKCWVWEGGEGPAITKKGHEELEKDKHIQVSRQEVK